MKFGSMIFGLLLALVMCLPVGAAETLSNEVCPPGGCPAKSVSNDDCCSRGGFMSRGPVRRAIRDREHKPVRRGLGWLFGRRGCRGCN